MTAARLTVDPRFPIGAVRRRLFGGFVEHLGRHVYDGIYEHGHPAADDFLPRIPPYCGALVLVGFARVFPGCPGHSI